MKKTCPKGWYYKMQHQRVEPGVLCTDTPCEHFGNCTYLGRYQLSDGEVKDPLPPKVSVKRKSQPKKAKGKSQPKPPISIALEVKCCKEPQFRKIRPGENPKWRKCRNCGTKTQMAYK